MVYLKFELETITLSTQVCHPSYLVWPFPPIYNKFPAFKSIHVNTMKPDHTAPMQRSSQIRFNSVCFYDECSLKSI